MNAADDRRETCRRTRQPIDGTADVRQHSRAVATSEETIGERIHRLRIEQGLSLRDVAGPGISFAHVSRLEAGRRSPSPQALRLLARRLGVSAEFLETGRRARGYALRDRRLGDAELELRLDRDLERAEAVFRAELDPRSGLDPDEMLAARAEAGLGLLAWRRSKLRETIRHLEAATKSGYLHPASHPELYQVLGEAYTAYGAPAKAIDLFERCLADLPEGARDGAIAVPFLNYLALAASALGDGERVRRALAEANERAGDSGVPQARISFYWTLARSLWGEGRSQAARDAVERAIDLLESTEDTVQLARARILFAEMLTIEGEFAEAEAHVEAAARGLGAAADETDLGLLRAEQAKVAAARGEADSALQYALDAERLLADDVRYGGMKWHALAAARAAAGDVEAAVGSYRKALQVLEERSQWREAAHVARELVRFLRAEGRESEAWEVLDRMTALAGRRLRPAARV